MLQDITFLGYSSRQKATPVRSRLRQAGSEQNGKLSFDFNFGALDRAVDKPPSPWHHVIFSYENPFHAPNVLNMYRGPMFLEFSSLKYNSSMIKLVDD